jgi:chromosome segregation protein
MNVMYLKRIEIYGFKSFADKIDIDLLPGITAIVGPNGSGKSNIADAIRWVLGEQSPKVLRGSRMEDIIFSGADSRKPVGMAEVSMILDNSDRALDMDYSEIKVTRRMFKSGESEYYLNKALCRLKDIQQLFMDTGVGKEGYSIIGQGRIDQLLSDRPQERRGIFEEAAGIVKYKSRKIDAEKKLEQTIQNLQRVEDILSELELQLGPLEQESRKARHYIQLLDELKYIDINLFLYNYHRLKEQIARTEQESADIKETLYQKEQSKQADEAALAQQKALLGVYKDKIEALHADILNNRGQSERLNGLINSARQRIEYLENDLSRLKKEISDKQDQQQHYAELMVGVKAELESLENKRTNVLKELDQYKEQLADVDAALDRYKASVKNGESQIMDIIDRQSQLKSKLSVLTSELQSVTRHMVRLDGELESLYADENHLVSTKLRIKKDMDDARLNLEQQELLLKSRTADISDIEAKIKEIAERRTGIDRSIHSDASRLKLLQDMENNMEGFNRSVKLIMDQRLRDAEMNKGIYGPVGRLIQVDAEYETAFEAALGGSIQYLVTRNDDDARYAINFLKARQGGRATFLPISAIKPRRLSERERAALKHEGCIGVACDIARFSPEFSDVVGYLLGRVLICDDLAHAIDIARAFKYSFQIVTLEGDVVGSGGYISGGSLKRRESDILSRSGQIQRLEQAIEEHRHSYAAMSKQMDMLSDVLNEQRKQRSDIEGKLSQLHVEYARMEETIKNLEQQQDALTHKREAMEQERLTLSENQASLEREIEQCKAEIAKVEQQRHSFAQDAQENDKRIQDLTQQREDIMGRLTQIQVSAAKLESECASLRHRLDEAEANIERAKADVENKLEQIKCNDEEKIAVQEGLDKQRMELEEHRSLDDKLQQDIKRLEREQEALYQEIAEKEEDLHDLNEVVADLSNKLYKCDVQKQHLEEQLQSLQEEIWESYQLSYANALKYRDDGFEWAKASKDRTAIKEEIAAIGPVNPGAIEEYERIYQRVEFLRRQHDDLSKAIQTLQDLIADLEADMRRQFAGQFSVINNNFQRIFRRLFGGGSASLILEDGDVLEAGIDIIAQPPGKKLQNIMLLSGGERTLTAIAILFALLEIRPSPFCVLDEIEAALDEVNAQRFANFIQDYSQNIQFIIITHRRPTMEVASALYGVSMVERGVSKLISVQLDEKTG